MADVAKCGRHPWLRACMPWDCARFEACTGGLHNRLVHGRKADCVRLGTPKYEARKEYLHWLHIERKRIENSGAGITRSSASLGA